jgi:hypothetical protein
MSVRPSSPNPRTIVGVLLVLSLSAFAVFAGGTASATDTRVGDTRTAACPPNAGGTHGVSWHLQRYGAGCHGNDYVRFPEGEQIDQIGDPPWVPL